MKPSLHELIGVRVVARTALGAIILLSVASLPLRAAEPSAGGLWEQVDEKSGKPESWFRIVEKNGVYEGTVAKIFFKPGEDENWACDKCEGDEKGRPVLGLALIKGMQRNGLDYKNGTIMNPRDGAVYRATMELSPDGQKLKVRGYLLVEILGRTQIWNRLPDNALQPVPAPRSPAPKSTPPKK
jgi:uncharacterized protein (DUF2147 family)